MQEMGWFDSDVWYEPFADGKLEEKAEELDSTVDQSQPNQSMGQMFLPVDLKSRRRRFS